MLYSILSEQLKKFNNTCKDNIPILLSERMKRATKSSNENIFNDMQIFNIYIKTDYSFACFPSLNIRASIQKNKIKMQNMNFKVISLFLSCTLALDC